MGTSKFNAGSSPAVDRHPIQGGVEILLVTSCYRCLDKLQPDGPSSLVCSELAWSRPNPRWPPTIIREFMMSWPPLHHFNHWGPVVQVGAEPPANPNPSRPLLTLISLTNPNPNPNPTRPPCLANPNYLNHRGPVVRVGAEPPANPNPSRPPPC